jgi:eukaryotic-like serine/threonine-protein kinase
MLQQPLAITELTSRPLPQRRIGPFLLLQQLGEGGFAPVWAARETYEGKDVRDAAVKLFVLGRQSNAARDRLIHEAQALCRVDHPHIVRFYSLVLDEPLGLGALAMELVRGQSLGQRIQESGPLLVPEVLNIGLAIARALAEVHRAGLLHRDVKPDNIVQADGTYKLIDFGIAFSSEVEDDEGTFTVPADTAKLARRVTGTLGFVAPECFQGQPSSIASDLYALGATLHACLLGYPPAARKNEVPWDFDPDVLSGRRLVPPTSDRAPHAPAPFVELLERLILPKLQNVPRVRHLPAEEVGPFRGLGRFEAEDRDVFFGRDGEIGSVLELLRHRHFVVLVGPSGSGKSSLARAGVLPRVVDGALERWPKKWDTTILAPGSDPRATLLKTLSVWLGHSVEADVDDVVAALEDCVQEAGRGLLLLVDPLEELITLDRDMLPDSKQFFIDVLVRLSDSAPEGIKWLGAARRDLLEPLLSLPGLGKTIARSLVVVEPLTPSVLRDVFLMALDAYGYTLEDDALVDELFVGIEPSSEAMPLVAFVLTEAWRMRDTRGKRLTRVGLLAMGGVRGALEKHAETTLARFTQGDAGKLDAARRMLSSLTTPEGTRTTKSLDKLNHIGGEVALLFVKTFVAARLCVPVDGGVTLAHEALVTQWPRLSTWLKEARSSRLVVAELERAARFWKTDPEVAPLLTNARVGRFQHAAKAADCEWLSDDAQAYLSASLAAARIRRRRMAIGLLTTTMAGLLGFLVQGRATNSLWPTKSMERELPALEPSSLLEQTKVADVRSAEPIKTTILVTESSQIAVETPIRSQSSKPIKSAPPKNALPSASANGAPIVVLAEKPAESTGKPVESSEVKLAIVPSSPSLPVAPSAKKKEKRPWDIDPERTIK